MSIFMKKTILLNIIDQLLEKFLGAFLPLHRKVSAIRRCRDFYVFISFSQTNTIRHSTLSD